MSLGEDRVRVKQKPEDPAKKGEFLRLTALAMTHYEDAAMWAVKAATF
jgi:hypothetical protein